MLPFPIMNQYGNTVVYAKIKKVQTGLNHIAVLGGNGTLYTRGRNSNGQLGVGDTTDRTTWQTVQTNVQDVWCSLNGTLIKKFDNTWFVAGNAFIGGINNANATVFTDCTATFNTLPSTSSILQIVVSAYSTMVLMADGTLWGTGANSSNEITGTGTQYNSTFKQLTTPSTPVKIWAGYNSMAYIDASRNFYYSGIIRGINTAGGTQVSAFTLYNPAESTTLKCVDFKGAQYGCFFLVQNTSTNAYSIYTGGSEYFGQLANNANSSTERALTLVSTIPFTQPIYRFYNGYAYYAQHVVTQNGVYGAGQNNTSFYIGKMGAGSTANLLTYTLCPLSGVTDFTQVEVHHCLYRTYVLANDTLYSSGQNVTYSNVTPSTSYIPDSPSL